jgi:hypothetical protein
LCNVDIIETKQGNARVKLISDIKWIPGYIRFMIVVTFAYLSVEIPFSVYLNMFMSGSSTAAEMQSVEEFGRMMTGIAVAIAVLGQLLPKFKYQGRSFRNQVLTGGFAAIAAVGVTYGSLKAYAEISADLASNEDMRSAYVGVITRQKLATFGIGDLTPQNDNAAWRALVATAPMAANTTLFANSLSTSIESLALEEADRSIGTMSDFRKAFFGMNFNRVRESYNQYADGSDEYVKRTKSIYKDGEAEWTDYINGLNKKYPEGIPLRGWTTASIRNEVIARLPGISSNWNIIDKSGFMIAYTQKASAEIRRGYADKVNSVLGGDGFIEPAQSFDAFLANPVIQSRLRDEITHTLGFKFGPGTISPSMSDAAFQSIIFNPAVASIRNDFVKMASDATTFDGAVAGAKGRSAYQAATLPSLAILLSLAGAALHIFKLSSYLFQAFGFMRGHMTNAYSKRKYGFGGMVLASVTAMALLWGNPVTTTDAFRSISQTGVYAVVLEKAIAVQPGMQVLGNILRNTRIWDAVSTGLPAPRPFTSRIANKAPANLAAEAVSSKMPIPTPRPEV